jgi:hypothetical protein
LNSAISAAVIKDAASGLISACGTGITSGTGGGGVNGVTGGEETIGTDETAGGSVSAGFLGISRAARSGI